VAEELGRPRRIALPERLADGARGHGLAADLERGQHAGHETELGRELGQQGRRAARVVAEGVIEAHHDLLRPQGPDEHPLHEVLRLDSREVEGEGNDERRIGADAGHALEIVLEGGNGNGRPFGTEHGGWVRVERAHHRGHAKGPGALHRGLDEAGVGEMNAVEDPERRHAGAELRRVGREPAENPHAGVDRPRREPMPRKAPSGP